MEVGDHVVYVDSTAGEHHALVTAVWNNGTPTPSLNVVYVSDDPAATDQYGQTARVTRHVCRASQQPGGARHVLARGLIG